MIEKRLAARLAPRFLLKEDPSKLNELMTLLLHLFRYRIGNTLSEQEICDKIRNEVLNGFLLLCEKAMKTQSNPQEITSKIIEALLKYNFNLNLN